MAGFLTLVVVVGAYASVICLLALIARKVRRSGVSSSLLGVWDEIYRPSQENTRIEIHAEDERGAPRPSADDLKVDVVAMELFSPSHVSAGRAPSAEVGREELMDVPPRPRWHPIRRRTTRRWFPRHKRHT